MEFKPIEELKNRYQSAKEILSDSNKIEDLLASAESKLKEFPFVGEQLAEVITLISMLKSYITREYTDIPFGSLIAVVASLIYFITNFDFIPDVIPIAGYLDDLKVVSIAMNLIHEDIQKYKKWQEERSADSSQKSSEE